MLSHFPICPSCEQAVVGAYIPSPYAGEKGDFEFRCFMPKCDNFTEVVKPTMATGGR